MEAKFIKDTFWLYFSFFIFVISGLSINLFIIFNYSITDLGIFIQIYTIYLIWSQFAVFGINDSAQRNISYNIDNEGELNNIKLGALLIGFFVGLAFSFLLYILSSKIGQLVESPSVGNGMKIISPAILFFTINKIFLGILNGERRIRFYSLSQSLRSFLILFIVIVISFFSREPHTLSYSFLIAEVLLFVLFSISLVFGRLTKMHFRKIANWAGFHLIFGSKAFPASFFYESYLKIDILMVAIFLNDYKVGVYSFASMFFEGIYQVPHMIKTNVNPMLVAIIKKYKSVKIDNFIKSLFLLSLFVTSFFMLLVIVIYPFLNPYFPNNIVKDTHLIICLLFAGLFFYSGFIPFDSVLLQAGKPLIQTFLFFLNVITNVTLNLFLIPIFGLYGAAIATSIALTIAALNLVIFCKYNKLISY